MRETKLDKKSISIKNIVIIVFIILMLTTVCVIGYIVFSNWLSSVTKTIAKMSEDMNAEISNQVDTFINVPLHINEVNHSLIENGIVDINNETERESFFVEVLKTHSWEDVYSFSYGTENGEYYGSRKNENNDIEIMRNNVDTNGESWYYSVTEEMTAGELVVRAGKFDPRTRGWYKVAKEAQKPVFSPVYKHFVMNDLTVSAAYPIYNKDGGLRGVLGTHITLSKIDEYLKEIVKDKNAFAVIVEMSSGELIANSLNTENFRTLEDGSVKRLTIDEIDNQVLIEAQEKYENTKESNFKIKNEKDELYINLTEHHEDGLDWLVITAIPESLFMASIADNMKLTLSLTIVALLLSLTIYLKLTNLFLKPLNNLMETAEKFSLGDFSKRVTIVRNDEIGMMSKSFNKLADTIYALVNNLESKVKERTVELEETNTALEENKDKLQLILDSAAEAIYGLDNDGNCTYCNASFLKMLRYNDQDELIGKNMHLQIHHSRRDGTSMPIDECKIFQTSMMGEGTRVDDEVFWRADGTSFDVEYYSHPQYKGGKIVGSVVTFTDITETKKNVEHIKYLSRHDSLTGLYNRMFFDDELKMIDTKKNLPISIIFGDINGLKLTNDIFGHAAGDALIKKSAEIMKNICREEDIVARVGGDEFAIILPNTEECDVKEIIARVKKELSREQIVAIKGSISMGYDTKTSADIDIKTTMKNAEDGMYKEKTLDRKIINSDMIKIIMESLHDKSPREKQHSLAVSEMCENIGKSIKLSELEIRKLKDAGFLHDIGKIVLSKEILNKKDELNDEEKKEMQQHSVIGYRVLNSFDDTMDLAESILAHHESWDGSGYPKGLKGEKIPKLARVIAVADSYDEILNNINGNAVKQEDAVHEIKRQSGIKFDPEIVKIFVKMIEYSDYSIHNAMEQKY